MPTRDDAIQSSDRFYNTEGGFGYTDAQVDRWLSRWFAPFEKLRKGQRVLDLCCGNGCWTAGLLRIEPGLEIVGYDISAGGIEAASARAAKDGTTGRCRFAVHDCSRDLPEPDESFDLIFARGLFLYNQHDMMRPAAISLLRHWHRKLKRGGRFVGMYGSKSELMGTYTPFEDTARFPMNEIPEASPYRVFHGGKYHHTVASFTAPFFELDNARLKFFQFQAGRHTIVMVRV